MPRDLNCLDLPEVRRRVVEPVVHALIRPEELESLHVLVRGPSTDPFWGTSRLEEPTLFAVITARGETFDLYLGSVSDEPWDAQETADWLYDKLSEELPESGFAWGEQRDGRFEVPAAGQGSNGVE